MDIILKGINTSKELYSSINQLEGFRYYLNMDLSLNKPFSSPLRDGDKNPSCYLTMRNGVIRYYDFGKIGHQFDLIALVQHIKNLSYHAAIERIYCDLKELFSYRFSSKKHSNRNSDGININSNDRYLTPRFLIRSFTPYDIKYWKSYGISLSTLAKYHVYSLEYATFDKSKSKLNYENNSPLYGYFFKEFKYAKYYKPEEKGTKKWRSNTPKYLLQGFEQLQYNSSTLILTKGLKDVCSLYEIGYESVAPVNETVIPKEEIKKLKELYRQVFVLYDNDVAGQEGSRKLCDTCEIDQSAIIFIDGAKDASDLIKAASLNELKRQINDKIKNNIN